MPVMQLDTATAERVLEALVRSCDKTVERNGHVTGGFAHAASTARVRRNHRRTCRILGVQAATSKSFPRRSGTLVRAFRLLGEPHRLYESGLRIEILGRASVRECHPTSPIFHGSRGADTWSATGPRTRPT